MSDLQDTDFDCPYPGCDGKMQRETPKHRDEQNLDPMSVCWIWKGDITVKSQVDQLFCDEDDDHTFYSDHFR